MGVKDGSSLPPAALAEVRALAQRAERANGPLMRVINGFGGQIEAWVARLPKSVRRSVDGTAEGLLTRLYDGAGTAGRFLPKQGGDMGHKLAAAVSGAAGGSAGMASAAVELPATVMVMFSAMQRIAAEAGFDPNSEAVRLTCIDIFGSGGPGTADDGLNTGFVGSRLTLNGTTIHALISRVVPAFSTMLTKTLAAKAVPILGAAAGAGINYAFASYYTDVARVRFGLQRLVETHGEAAVTDAYEAARAGRLAA